MNHRIFELLTVLILVSMLWTWDWIEHDELMHVWNCAAVALWVIMFFVVRPIVLDRMQTMDDDYSREKWKVLRGGK